MAEGDTVLRMARRIEAAFGEGMVLSADAPNPKNPIGPRIEELVGRRLDRAETRGKHLILHLGEDLALHAHMGMNGGWYAYRPGQRWKRPRRSAWLVLDLGYASLVQFGGTMMRLVRPAELGRDSRLSLLGPDILAGPAALEAGTANLLGAKSLEIGEALLNQRLIAGIGNIFKSESCFEAGVDPWRKVDTIDPELMAGLVETAARQMERGVETGRRPGRIYRKSGRPCIRCGTLVRSRGQGVDNRTTYWCPGCQT
jgi:endonuclease-8